jgi:hypothetical protein
MATYRRIKVWDALEIAKRTECEHCLHNILEALELGSKTVEVKRIDTPPYEEHIQLRRGGKA